MASAWWLFDDYCSNTNSHMNCVLGCFVLGQSSVCALDFRHNIGGQYTIRNSTMLTTKEQAGRRQKQAPSLHTHVLHNMQVNHGWNCNNSHV